MELECGVRSVESGVRSQGGGGGARFQFLIQKAKEPKGYFVPNSRLNAIVDDIAVGDILYLRKTLASTSHLEKVLPIDKEVPFWRIGDFVPRATKLIEEKRFTYRPAVCPNCKRVHDICVVAIYLVRAGEIPKIRRL